jgi:ribonuclease P protein component
MTTVVEDRPVAAPRPELWRITDRRSFDALRRSRSRARRGPVAVTWLAPTDEGTPPRAGFTVPRTVGGAVLRNRIRRRLRAALRELQRDGRLPAGTYLVAGQASVAELPWPELVALLDATLAEARS